MVVRGRGHGGIHVFLGVNGGVYHFQTKVYDRPSSRVRW